MLRSAAVEDARSTSHRVSGVARERRMSPVRQLLRATVRDVCARTEDQILRSIHGPASSLRSWWQIRTRSPKRYGICSNSTVLQRFPFCPLQRWSISQRWTDVTAGQFATKVEEVAKGFIATCLRTGDRVALMSSARCEGHVQGCPQEIRRGNRVTLQPGHRIVGCCHEAQSPVLR